MLTSCTHTHTHTGKQARGGINSWVVTDLTLELTTIVVYHCCGRRCAPSLLFFLVVALPHRHPSSSSPSFVVSPPHRRRLLSSPSLAVIRPRRRLSSPSSILAVAVTHSLLPLLTVAVSCRHHPSPSSVLIVIGPRRHRPSPSSVLVVAVPHRHPSLSSPSHLLNVAMPHRHPPVALPHQPPSSPPSLITHSYRRPCKSSHHRHPCSSSTLVIPFHQPPPFHLHLHLFTLITHHNITTSQLHHQLCSNSSPKRQ